MAILSIDQVSRRARDFFEKGFKAMETNNLDYAMDMFLQALELEPGFGDARKFLQGAAVRKFKNNKGGEITHIITSITGFIPAMIARTKISKKPLEALHAAEKLYRTDPYNSMFVFLLCDAAEALGMPEVAVMCLEILREKRSDDESLLLKLGEAYANNEQTSQARECYQALAQMKPNNQNYVKLYKDATAIDTMQQGGWGQGASYRDMIKDTKEAESLEQAQRSVKSASDLEEMIAETKEKIDREPDNINYKRALGDLYSKNNQVDEAIQVLEEAQASTSGGDPAIDRMISELRLSKMKEELKKLEDADDTAGAEAQRQAISDYQIADTRDRVRRYPNDLDFKYELGVLLFGRGEMTEAIQQFQASQKNPRRRISSLFHLALCFKDKGQMDIAREQLAKASSELPIMDDMKKDVLYEQGLIADSMGNAKEAVEFFKEIYSVDIGYKDIAERIENAYKAL